MIKRILLASLFLFMPIFAHGDVVFGENMDEKNIPLDMDIMTYAFEKAFDMIIQYNDHIGATNKIQDKFYNYLFNKYSAPFSLRDLVDVCRKGVGKTKTKECVDFVNLYVNRLVEYHGSGVFVPTVKVDKLAGAIDTNDVATVERYIQQGGNVNIIINKELNQTPLNRAAMKGQEQIVDMLIKAGAYVNVADANNITPLAWAVYENNEKITLSLIKAGANVNVSNIIGDNLIASIISKQNINMFHLLAKAGVDLHITEACNTVEQMQDWEYYTEVRKKVCF